MTARIFPIATPMPMGPRAVNAYLVPLDAGGYMLVDGGMNTEEAWLVLDQGVRAQANWSEVRLHFTTHMHQDHVGLNSRVREACSAPLLMAKLDAVRMANAASAREEEASYREELLRSSGVPADLIKRAASFAAGASSPPFVAADLTLDHPDCILPFAPEWRAIWTPGHTAGHTVLFREADSVLLSGDAVLPEIEPTVGVNRQRPDPVGDHLYALATICGLDPIQILPGHGESFRGCERILASRASLLRDSERALLLVGPRATAWEVNVQLHAARNLRTGALLHELRGTLAHLEHHLVVGKLTVFDEGGVCHFIG